MNEIMPTLPSVTTDAPDRPRYLVIGRGPSEVWFAPRFDPETWILIRRWPDIDQARAAVTSYLRARSIARDIGARV